MSIKYKPFAIAQTSKVDEILYKRGFGLKYSNEEPKQEYKILEGNNQVITANNDLSIRANGNIEDLVMLKVDGKELDKKN